MPNMPTGNMNGPGGGSGLMGGLSDFFGTSNKYQATPYQTNQSNFNLSGGVSNSDMNASRLGYAGNAAADRANQLGARGQQQDYLSQLQNAYAGNGPSQAAGIMQQAGNQAAAQSMSLARSMNAANPAQQAAAMRAAQMQGAQAITAGGAQAAQIKAQEQQNALAQMGGTLQGMRGADLQSQGMGQGMEGTYLGAQQQAAATQLGANIQHEQINSGNYNAAQGINAGVAGQNAQSNAAMLSGVAEGAGKGLAAMSDKRAKTDVAPAGGRENEDAKQSQMDEDPSEKGVAGIFTGFGRALRGGKAPQSTKQPEPKQSGGFNPTLAKALGEERFRDTRPMMHPPQPTADQAIAASAGAPVASQGGPMPISAVMGGPGGNANFFGVQQGEPAMQRPVSNPNFAVATPGAPSPDQLAASQAYLSQAYAAAPRPAPFAAGAYGPYSDLNVPSGINLKTDITSDAQAKQDAFEAGVVHGQNGRVLFDATKPYHPLLNAYVPTNEYIGPGGAGLAAFQDRNGKLVKEKALDLSGKAPVHSIVPIEHPRDRLMPPGYQPSVGAERQAIEDSMRAQGGTPEQPMIELDDYPTMTPEYMLPGRPGKIVKFKEQPKTYDSDTHAVEPMPMPDEESYYQRPVGASLPRPYPPMQAEGTLSAMADGALRGATGGMVPSDERMKGGIASHAVSEGTKSGQRTEADMFLEHLRPYTYRYKDPSNEPSSQPTGGRYLGVMAQDVEQSPTGPQIVKDTPRGKILEGGALMSALAGGVGRLHQRLSALESRRG